MTTKTILLCLMLAAGGLVAMPTVAADDHCPPPAMPSPNPVDAIVQTYRAVARPTCQTLDTTCEAAGIDGERCWITLE